VLGNRWELRDAFAKLLRPGHWRVTTCSGRRFGRTLKVEEVATQLVILVRNLLVRNFPIYFIKNESKTIYQDFFFVEDVLPSSEISLFSFSKLPLTCLSHPLRRSLGLPLDLGLAANGPQRMQIGSVRTSRQAMGQAADRAAKFLPKIFRAKNLARMCQPAPQRL